MVVASYPASGVVHWTRAPGLRFRRSAFDPNAACVALAESLGATLLTCEAKIAAAAGRYAIVRVV